MTWVNKGIYWAWTGGEDGYCNPPTEKKILYAHIKYPKTSQNLAVTVLDNGVETDVFRDELEWHRKNGAVITMPVNA